MQYSLVDELCLDMRSMDFLGTSELLFPAGIISYYNYNYDFN